MRLNKDDYMILPDSELREQLRKDKNKLRWLSFPIVGYIVLLVIFLPELTSINASMGLVGYSTAAAIVCYTFIFADTPGKQKKLVIALDLIQFGLIILGFINAVSGGSYSTVFFQFLLAGGANGANLIARPIIKEMSDLREHPRYPFDNWRRDESFTHAVFTNGSTDSRAVKRIESTLNQGKVVSGGHEDIFEGDVKKSEPAKEELVELFQEKARVWTDESDKTSYILDNLDKMYFDDGLQNGELVGEELEKQLRKATAPAKPPEETPEDFFQQQTIVWRPQKHGSTNEGPREDPSASSEEKSRTVLM